MKSFKLATCFLLLAKHLDSIGRVSTNTIGKQVDDSARQSETRIKIVEILPISKRKKA